MKYLLIIIGICLLAFTGCNNTVTSPGFLNLSLDETIPGMDDVLYSWHYNPRENGYTMKPVNNPHGGKAMFITCRKPVRNHNIWGDSLAVGRFAVDLPAELVRGKEIVIRSKIRTKAVTRFAGLHIVAYDSTHKKALDIIPTEETGIRGTKNWQETVVEATIPEGAIRVFIGGLLYERGSVWFDDFEVSINGKRLVDDPSVIREPEDAEVEWLRQYVYPLKTTDPEVEDDSDLAPLGEFIGEASFVALGDVSYGFSEAYKLNHRILKYLAEHKRFNHISVNTTFSRASTLNDYVQKGIGSRVDVVGKALLSRNSLRELSALVQWARDSYEAGQPVYFSGHILNVYYQMSLDIFKEVFSHSPEIIQTVKTLEDEYQKIRENDLWGKLSDDEINAFHMLASPLYEAILNTADEEERTVLSHSYRLFEQSITCNQANYIPFMVENILWEQQHYKGTKMVFWGGNGDVSAGNQLLQALADSLSTDIPSIGLAFGKLIPRGDKKKEAFYPVDAFPGCFEYYFSKLGESLLLIDLRSARKDLSPHGEWLRKRLLFRYMPMWQSNAEFFPVSLVDNFDYLIYIDGSSTLN